MTRFRGKAPVLLTCIIVIVIDFPVLRECHAMGKWYEIKASVSYGIRTFWYYKMIPSNDSIKLFHHMISLSNFI